MLFRSPFFRRLFIPNLVLIVFGTGLMGLVGGARLRETYLEDQRRTLRDQAHLVEALIEREFPKPSERPMSGKLRAIAAASGCRITLVAEDGRVVADTMGDPSQMDNHRLRPEIVEAAGAGEGVSVRRSDTVDMDMMYFARRTAAAAEGIRFIRLALPLARLNEHLGALYLGLAAAAACAIAAAGGICFTLARRHARPLIELTALAEALSRGELHQRSSVQDRDEAGVLAQGLNAMAESLSRLVSQVAKDKQEILTILAAMNEGVIATDREQRIILTNEAASDQLGFPAAAAEGKLLWEIVREEAILKAAPQVLASGEKAAFELGPLRGRTFEVVLCPLPPAGSPEGLVIVAHDTTESKKYDRLRRDFVANVSHELRTPLSVIKGFVETLKEGALQDPVKAPEFLAIVEKHVAQLTNLVNDLLDLARLESRPDLPRRTRVDLREVVANVIDLTRPMAEKRKQSLAPEVGPEPIEVDGDPDYLARAVSNLVDNAIKYTPEGGNIRVSARRQDGHAVVEVSDNGIGIPAEDLPRIFERFYRVDKSRSRDMGGTGLGLAIVKHVVQVHGGTVQASSEPGKGSTFRITLPARRASRAEPGDADSLDPRDDSDAR